MWQLLVRVATAVHMAAFAVACLVCLPAILFNFGASAVCHWIETRWPDSDPARAFSFWLRLLAPLALTVVMAVILWFTVARMRERPRLTDRSDATAVLFVRTTT